MEHPRGHILLPADYRRRGAVAHDCTPLVERVATGGWAEADGARQGPGKTRQRKTGQITM
jgi:hypothetical protein